MKNKLLFWLSLVFWIILAALMVVFANEYLKDYTTLSYFWCAVIAFGCGVGVIFFPVVTLINIFFTTEKL